MPASPNSRSNQHCADDAEVVAPLGTRSDFPICDTVTYLDNAFIGPVPKPVRDAAFHWYNKRSTEETDIYGMFDTIEIVRRQFAGMINASPDEIGFLYTTSEGENIICRALDLLPGQNIVTDDLAYPHVGVLGKKLEQEQQIDFRIVEHTRGAVTVESFAARVDSKTRLVVVPWISNISAHRHDIRGLAKLAHAAGAYLYVDAIQILGTEPIDVKAEDIDFLCAGTYKWLMAGWGIAPIYIRRELIDAIRPDRYGWQTALSAPSAAYNYTHRTSAAKFEYASPSFDQFMMLTTALSYLDGIGLDQIAHYSRYMTSYLRGALEALDFTVFTPKGDVSPSLTFWVGAGEKDVEAACRQANIRVGFASGHRMSETYGSNESACRVRISPAHYNLRSDLDALLNVVERLPRFAGYE
ncbi:MAG: aminotransferase class V-fold PLP-dependent enzyme [Xanthomonadales bacterium]|nr:aminotransferase class V-fold PLP-dependent enzyme [Xanthomonadales bacterium]